MHTPSILIFSTGLSQPRIETLTIEKNRWVIGRDSTCDIQILNDIGISRKHCTILMVSNSIIQYQLFDGLLGHTRGSKFGLFIDNKKVKSHILKHGDIIRISPSTHFEFIYEDDDLVPNNAKNTQY